MVLYPNPAGRADVSGLNFFFNCVRFALLHTRRVGSCLSNASAPPTFLFFPCTSMVLSVTTSGVWLDLHMGPHAPPEPLPRSASPARGPHLVLGAASTSAFCPDISPARRACVPHLLHRPSALPSKRFPVAQTTAATRHASAEEVCHHLPAADSPALCLRALPLGQAPAASCPACLRSIHFCMGSRWLPRSTGLFQPTRIIIGVGGPSAETAKHTS